MSLQNSIIESQLLKSKSNLDELRLLSSEVAETESRLSAFWSITPTLKCIVGEGKFIKVNPYWTNLLGYDSDSLIGHPYQELIHPGDLDIVAQVENALAHDKRVTAFLLRFKHNITGEYHTIEWYASPNIKAGLIFASGIDRTTEIAQKEALEASVKEIALLKNAIDNSTNGVIIAEAQTPVRPIVYVNKAFTDLTGYSKEELVGNSSHMLLSPPVNAEDGLQKQLLSLALHDQKPFNGILSNKRKDGSQYMNYLKLTPLKNNTGDVTHFTGSAVDFSEEYAEKAVLKAALQYSPFGIFLTDILGDCIYTNTKWEELSGLTFEESKGKGWIAGICSEYQDEIKLAWYSFVLENRGKSGVTFEVDTCFHNRKLDIITNVKVRAYFYDTSTTIGYIEIQPSQDLHA